MEFKRHRAALVRIDRGCWESIQRVWTLRCKHRSGCRLRSLEVKSTWVFDW